MGKQGGMGMLFCQHARHFSDSKVHDEIRTGSPHMGAINRGGVG